MAKKSSGGARGQSAGAQAPPAAPTLPDHQPAAAEAPVQPPRPTPPAAPPSEQQGGPVTLRTGEDPIILRDNGALAPELPFTRAALRWTYIVRNRRRWSTLPSLRKEKA